MGFLDKAREKAEALAGQAKEKFEDVQAKRKADDLLDDLGRIVYRQRTERSEAGDEAEIARIVGELRTLEADGTPVLQPKGSAGTEAEAAPPAPPAGGAPLPPPPPPAAPNGGHDVTPS